MTSTMTLSRRPNGATAFDAFDKMFAPLFQQSVGFDRLYDTMNTALRETSDGGNYPPYDIVQTGEDHYAITLALAGFTTDDIEIQLDNGVLNVTGDKAPEVLGEGASHLHRGIANRKFCRRFRLTDHILVGDAKLKDGMLTIHLLRELPEALKPRTIEVNSN
jgi:molecular chaperone IbpA